MQNHDQIGNRAFGERINAIASSEAVHAIAAVYLLLPQTPMLFMGEEWSSSQPFPFFCDLEGELGELVRKGRKEEFANFPEFQNPEQRERIPDPLAQARFQSAKLDWAQLKEEVHAEWLEWYRRILEVRKRSVIPHIQEMEGYSGLFEVIGAGAIVVRFWNADSSRQLVLAANLSDESREGFPCPTGQLLWQEGAKRTGTIMRPWSVCWTLQDSEKK
jgi:maltooligosyltrehalose trehalohydrolase